MDWLESLLYGLFMGFSEYIPVSSRAHDSVLNDLLGIDGYDPLRSFIIRISALLALVICCRQMLGKIIYEMRLSKRFKRTKSARGTMRSTYDLKLVKTATIPMFAALLFYALGDGLASAKLWVVLFLTVNGIVLYVTDHIRQGNKDARLMSGLDAIGIGFSSIGCALPGISRFGANTVFAVFRGADKQNAVNWALLLSIPALLYLSVFDLFSMIIGNSVVISGFLSYLFSSLGTFVGAYLAIILVRFLSVRAGFSGYAYYSWGLAMFTFVLYLIV